MNKICIDASPSSGELSGIAKLLALFLSIGEYSINLTEGEIYSGKYCDCGKHFTVDVDDAGYTFMAYAKERFADIPDISEIDELLKTEVNELHSI